MTTPRWTVDDIAEYLHSTPAYARVWLSRVRDSGTELHYGYGGYNGCARLYDPAQIKAAMAQIETAREAREAARRTTREAKAARPGKGVPSA